MCFICYSTKKNDNDVDDEEEEEEELNSFGVPILKNVYLLAAAAAAILHLASFCIWMSPATFYFSF